VHTVKCIIFRSEVSYVILDQRCTTQTYDLPVQAVTTRICERCVLEEDVAESDEKCPPCSVLDGDL